MPTNIRAELIPPVETLPWRARQREELSCQIVHDSLHRREGWTRSYRLEVDGVAAGFGSVAVAGPWQGKPTVFEFYLLPACRAQAFAAYEAFLSASGARFFEVQSNDLLLTALTLTFAHNIETEKIVFRDQTTTHLPAHGASLRCVTAGEEIRASMERRQGGGEWVLEVNGAIVATGGILFHYNRPYGDIYMEVDGQHRRRGWGAYLVQELKRAGYELGAVPAARCNPTNLASRRTLQKAGFVPYAHILFGALKDELGSMSDEGSDRTT